jgi:hypothetical protein
MSVARIGEMQAKAGFTEELREFLLSILLGIEGLQGFESVRHYQSQDDPSKFMMIEV